MAVFRTIEKNFRIEAAAPDYMHSEFGMVQYGEIGGWSNAATSVIQPRKRQVANRLLFGIVLSRRTP